MTISEFFRDHKASLLVSLLILHIHVFSVLFRHSDAFSVKVCLDLDIKCREAPGAVRRFSV